MEGFIHREVQQAQINDLKLAILMRQVKFEAERDNSTCVLVKHLLEDGDEARFALANVLGDKLRADHRLARVGRPGQQQTVPLGNAATQKLIKLGDVCDHSPLSFALAASQSATFLVPAPFRRPECRPL